MTDAATPSADSRARAVLGRTIAGKFHIESFLGGGAMGAVYKARQLSLDKFVAIKLLHSEHAGDATFAARFQREAKAASKLDHPNSMRVLDFGQEPDGLLYIAMEYLDGPDLFHVIRGEWPMPAPRVADILAQALAALAVAHDMGIVHRDLKPENIMLVGGTSDDGHAQDVVKVCDFGIAKFTDGPEKRTTGGGQKLTTQGLVVGTPEYMSPEQGKGEPLDARSDLYSMGVILYQMLTGRVPFDAETALGIVLKHVTEEPLPPRQIVPSADARLEAVCLKAMRKKREERYQSAREMRTDLRLAIAATDPLAHAATAELPSVSSLANAPTAMAIDSGQVVALTDSKLTPAATATDVSRAKPSPRGRVMLAALGLALVAAGGIALWRTSARGPGPTLAMDSMQSTPVMPVTTLEPVHAQSPELTQPNLPAMVATASARSTTTVALPPIAHATAAGAAPSAPPSAPATVASPVPTPIPTAPPPVVAAPPVPTPPPPPPPAVPESPPFDPSHAHVEWSVGGAGGGATPGAVQRALGRSTGAWTQCYRSALTGRRERIEGTATLHLTTDESGNVVGAQVRGFDVLPAVKSCIAGSARVHIDGVDTGDAWADIQLSFRPE